MTMANLAVGLIFAIVALGIVVQGRPGYDNSRFQAWQGKLYVCVTPCAYRYCEDTCMHLHVLIGSSSVKESSDVSLRYSEICGERRREGLENVH